MKGQLSIIGILSAVIVVIFLGAMMPVILTQTANLQNATTGDPVTQTVEGLIPLFLIVAAIIGIVAHGQPTQNVGY